MGVNINFIPDELIFKRMDKNAAKAIENKIKLNLVIDSKNISLKNFDLKKFAKINNYFSKNYNHIVNQIIIINSNSIFQTVYNLLNPLLDKSYKDKIVIKNS